MAWISLYKHIFSTPKGQGENAAVEHTNVFQQHSPKQTTGNCNQIFRGKLFTDGQIFSEWRNTESQNLTGIKTQRQIRAEGILPLSWWPQTLRPETSLWMQTWLTHLTRASSSSYFSMRVIDLKAKTDHRRMQFTLMSATAPVTATCSCVALGIAVWHISQCNNIQK